MAVPPRLIRRRIRSVQNTKKITKAMELVAAAKMRRAVAAALKTRAYANLAWRMIESLEGTVGEDVHPLLRRANTTLPTMYIVMASDRGLCGGFNAQLFREVTRDVQVLRRFDSLDLAQDRLREPQRAERRNLDSIDRGLSTSASPPLETTRFVAIGKKAEQFIRRMNWQLVASFTNIAVAPTIAELRPIAKIAIDAFVGNEVGDVRIAFTDFVSSLRQQPRVKRLLPLQRIEEIGAGSPLVRGSTHEVSAPTEFIFEPDPRKVLDQMLPRLTELQVYQAYLETGASEHSARMLAMRNASDAAIEMVDDLTLSLNQARQSLITREIAEISAGRAALLN